MVGLMAALMMVEPVMVGALAVGLVTCTTPKVLMVLVVLVVGSVDLDQPLQTSKLLLVD